MVEKRPEQPQVSVADIVEGLLLFDEPMLNSRYHALLSRDRDPTRRRNLQTLPDLVIQSNGIAREAARHWMDATGDRLEQSFVDQGERLLLESFLSLAESQLRLIAFMARSAPTNKTRSPFDDMSDLHRKICDELRTVLRAMTSETAPASNDHPLRSVQEEHEKGSLRGQVEAAIRARQDQGSGIRRVVLSHVAHRHLRDQGCFRDGEHTLMGVPVALDLSWESAAFAIEGYDVVPLEEIVAAGPDAARREDSVG